MGKPFISVLLAVHQGQNYMRQAINSVLEQTYRNFELCIGCNGRNTDLTEKIAAEYREKNEDTVRVFFEYEKGKSNMLNGMLRSAKGDYIAIQDHDDVWHPEKLEKQVDWLQSHPEIDVLGTFYDCIDAHDEILFTQELETGHDDIVRECKKGINEIGNFTALIRTPVLREAGGWRSQWEGIEDFDLWLRLINSGAKFANIPELLGAHRLHKNSSFNTQTFDIKSLLNGHNTQIQGKIKSPERKF